MNGCPPSPALFSIVLEALARTIRWMKEIKGIPIEKSNIFILDDKIQFCTQKDPKEFTRRLLHLSYAKQSVRI